MGGGLHGSQKRIPNGIFENIFGNLISYLDQLDAGAPREHQKHHKILTYLKPLEF